VYGEDGDDWLTGGSGRDLVDGGRDDDQLQGNAGADTVVGGDGRDTLFGGRDDDLLLGGNGDDRLSGDRGSDVLTGGAGRDRFVFSGVDVGNGGALMIDTDRITDFVRGEDRIDLSAIDARPGTDQDDEFILVSQFTGRAGEARLTATDPAARGSAST
jgi:Ca2+-binding RTX toxin-like protein